MYYYFLLTIYCEKISVRMTFFFFLVTRSFQIEKRLHQTSDLLSYSIKQININKSIDRRPGYENRQRKATSVTADGLLVHFPVVRYCLADG